MLLYRTTWKKCCFSGDGEYVCAGSARQHALYVWEKSIGNLVKILHGTKGELLLDVVWHPVRPIITSISSGLVSIWAQNQVENWSAFAPDFKELDENVEYEERESEFDIEDEDKSVDLSAEAKHDEEIEVDVVKVDPIAAFCSSDEEYEDENALQFLPMAPEVEDPEDGWNSTQENPSGNENSIKENEPPDSDAGGSSSAKRKKTTSFDISLDGPPTDGNCRLCLGFWGQPTSEQFHFLIPQKLIRFCRTDPTKTNRIRRIKREPDDLANNSAPIDSLCRLCNHFQSGFLTVDQASCVSSMMNSRYCGDSWELLLLQNKLDNFFFCPEKNRSSQSCHSLCIPSTTDESNQKQSNQ